MIAFAGTPAAPASPPREVRHCLACGDHGGLAVSFAALQVPGLPPLVCVNPDCGRYLRAVTAPAA